MIEVTKYTRKADYPEDLVPIILQAYLSFVGLPNRRIFLEPISRILESKRAFDAKVKMRASFFYMQFKRPYAALKQSTSQIVRKRKTEKLSIDPISLYFKLHKDASGKNNQHNILLALNKRRPGRAAYICPLVLSKADYVSSINSELDGILNRFARNNNPLFGAPFPRTSNSITIQDILSLKHHIAIKPNPWADDEIHHYSFDENGRQLFFHGGVSLPDGTESFDLWLTEMYEKFSQESFSLENEEEFFSTLNILLEFHHGKFPLIPQVIKAGLPKWKALGDYLLSEHDIYQFAFLERED